MSFVKITEVQVFSQVWPDTGGGPPVPSAKEFFENSSTRSSIRCGPCPPSIPSDFFFSRSSSATRRPNMVEPAASTAAAADPSDLMSQLDALEHAEPLSAEDDLILRMEAVSKVRAKAARRETRQPKQGIAKKRRQPRRGAKP